MKAKMFSFGIGPEEFFELSVLVEFTKEVRNNPTAKMFHCDNSGNYESETDFMADGDCYVILADNLKDAKILAKKEMIDVDGEVIKHKVITLI